MTRKKTIPTPEPFTAGERMRTFTKAGYKTARALSERTGIGTPALSLYFSGQHAPGYRQLKAMFDAGMSLDWLFAAEDELHLFTMFRRGSTAPNQPTPVGQISDAELMAELTRRMAGGG